MGARRLVWIAMLAFGGGIAALMAASLLLQRAAGVAAPGDLRTSVMGARSALTQWDYGKLTTFTSDIARSAYQQMFDDANGGDPARMSKFKGVLSAMDTFPSVCFVPDMKPERIDVEYEVADGTSAARPTTSFVPREGGYFLRVFRFPVLSTEKREDATIVFHEGDNVAFDAALENLLDTLTRGSPEEFRTLMTLKPDVPAEEVRKQLDKTRALVMTYRDSRLRQMMPKVGPLPRGTKWFRIRVVGDVDGKKLWLDMTVVPGDPVRFLAFKAGLVKKRRPPREPPSAPPEKPRETPPEQSPPEPTGA